MTATEFNNCMSMLQDYKMSMAFFKGKKSKVCGRRQNSGVSASNALLSLRLT